LPETRDFKADPERGPLAACRYYNAGLRLVPINPTSKGACRKGFGKDAPYFCTMPEEFREDELIAILMGPCPLGTYAGGRWLMGFDLDGEFRRYDLEQRIGILPDTLTSKNERHLYYWLAPNLPGRDDIGQANDIFRTKAKTGGACDWRPCAGGYFIERGDWDNDFDVTRIVDLPAPAWALLLAARKRSGWKPAEPCRVAPDFRARTDERRTLPPEGRRALANSLASVWPEPGAGGGHDLALALGGILADALISEDEAIEFCTWIWDAAGAPYQADEVVVSMLRRRAPGKARSVFGWPKLREILLEHNEPAHVTRVLAQFARRMPGLTAPRLIFTKPKKNSFA